MKEQIAAIAYPLPEDIAKLKWFGDFEACEALIRQRLQENIPETLKEKLRMELVQLRRFPVKYTKTTEEVQQVLSERLTDWKPEELDVLRRENVIDWIFVKGEIRYISNFYENLVKIRKDIAARQKVKPVPAGGKTDAEIRDEMIARMKRDGAVTCRLKLAAEIRLEDSLMSAGRELTVHLPYPIEQDQMHDVVLESVTPAPTAIAPADAQQRTISFTGTPKALQNCRIVYSLKNTMHYADPDPEKVLPEQPDFCLEEHLPHISFTPYMRALTAEVIGDETNPLRKARKIYDFITTKVNYSYMRTYISLPVIPEYCCSRMRGDCGVQALTFVTMCRIAGIPAKWQSGLYADWKEAGEHDWAMFYVAPYGWMWVDCSFGGAAWRAGALERWNFYFGNMDPYRVVFAQEFQADFVPPMQSMRNDPYDNQVGEVDDPAGLAVRDDWHADVMTLKCELL